MKALLLIPLLFIIISANEQDSSQFFPEHFRDIYYDLKKKTKSAQKQVLIYTHYFDHYYYANLLEAMAKKDVSISIYTLKDRLSSSLKSLALYQKISIYFIDKPSSVLPTTLMIFDTSHGMSFSLPLDEEILKQTKGNAYNIKSVQEIKSYQKTLERMSKRNYFLD